MLWMIKQHYEANEVIKQYSTKYDKYSDMVTAYDQFQTGTAENNLFIRYGGITAIQAVVDNIATNAGNDPELAPFFGNLGKPGNDTGAQLKSTLDLQLSSLFSGPFVYPGRAFTRGVTPVGRSMSDSHRGLQITNDIFSRFLTVAVVPALRSAGVSDTDIAAAAPALESMRNQIISA